MIKLMIVDDEQIVREGIKFIIEKNLQDKIQIVAMAKTGREAIELYELKRPEIILMDIQMPGINGIEAIEAIKDIDSRVKFVIISAYEQFEYAKNAVKLGVNDYILKPINKQRLTEVLETVIKDIKKVKESRRREIETQEKLDKVLPMLEYGYIYSILMNNDYQKETIDYHSLLNIQRDRGFIMVIDFGEGDNPSNMENKIGTGFKNNLHYQSIRHAIKYKAKAVVGPLMVNRMVILVYEEMPENEYQQRVKAIELAENIQKNLEDITDSNVYIGIGSCYKSHRLNISYNEAVKAICSMTGESVLHTKDARKDNMDEKEYSFYKIKSDCDRILSRVEEGNVAEVEKQLNILFQKLNRDYRDDMDFVKNIVMELIVLIYNSGFRHDVLKKDNGNMNYIDEIKAMDGFFDIKNWSIQKTKEITELIKGEKESKVSTVIAEAMVYIADNYNKDLRLKEVAEAVAISPQYFSKIFKEELGVNFIDYLTNIRMDEAKKMLKEGSLSIKEICYQIGYNDPNYFSRLFKKVEGISPTDYH